MAYKITYPTQNNQMQAPQQPQEQQPNPIAPQKNEAEEQSLLQRAVSQVARPAARALESVRSLPRFASDVLTYLPNKAIEKVTGYKDVLGLPPEGEPQIGNFPSAQRARNESTEFLEKHLGKGANTATYKAEKLIDAVAGTLPIAWLTGGASSLPSAAASAARGNVASQGAESLGFGPLGQFVADLGGSFGYNLIKEGATPGKIRKLGEKKSKDLYNEARKIGPKVNVYADAKTARPSIQKEIQFLEGKSSGIEKDKIKSLLSELHDTDSLLNKPGVTALNVWDKAKHLNSLRKKTQDKDIQNLYDRVVGSLKGDVLNGEAATREGFSKVFNPAEDLHTAIKARSALGQILEDQTDLRNILSNPIAKLGVTGASLFKFGPKKTALAIPATYGARYLTRAYDFFRTPIAQELGKKIAGQAIEKNIPALTQSLTRLNKAADEYLEKNPAKKKYKIVYKKS